MRETDNMFTFSNIGMKPLSLSDLQTIVDNFKLRYGRIPWNTIEGNAAALGRVFENVPRVTNAPPAFMGIPVCLDPTMPESEIRLVDARYENGRLVRTTHTVFNIGK